MVNRLRLFNTQSQKLEKFNTNRSIGLYVCGITPYDTTHLGHAFTYISFDVLVRYLRFLKVEVKYVQNVTDIDDNILIRAKKNGQNWKELGNNETKKFLKDMDSLNWIRPDHYVRATDHIGEMIDINKTLLEKGYAYQKNGSVYFEVKKDPKFASRLCKMDYENALDLANERGNFPNDPNKKYPLDFILWQKSKKGEPFWESPWGQGRPGWHIECSAMSTKYLGIPVTIHGGGYDLHFPHHEAEISQSELSTGKKFVETWMHTAMVYSGNKKMSKSLGNMIFVNEILTKYSADEIRYFLLLHHYRSEWNFEEDDLAASARDFRKIRDQLFDVDESVSKDTLNKIGHDISKNLNDDLDTPRALRSLRKLIFGSEEEKKTIKKFGKDVFGFSFD